VRIHDDGFMSDDIAVNIEDILKEEEDEDIGKLHVLSLTEFHQALGDTWDAREAKIFLLTEGVLRDRVGLGNRWEHHSKEIYIMLFPTLSEIEADARAFEIAEELGRKIIGDRFDGERRPLVRIAGVDPKDALSADGTLNIELLEKAGREGQSAGSTQDQGKKKQQDDDDHTGEKGPDWQKKKWEHEDHQTDWQAQQHARSESSGGNWEKSQRAKSPELNADWVSLKREEEKKAKEEPQWVTLEKKDESAPPKVQAAKPATKTTFSLEFAPCWDKESQRLYIYRALFSVVNAKGEKRQGPPAYPLRAQDPQKLKTDLWVLQQTGKALFTMQTRNIVTPVFIPFQSSSLRGDNLEKVVTALDQYTPALRQRFFIPEILDDGQWTQDDLKHLCTTLKDRVQALALSPSPASNFQPPLCAGLDWVGIDFSDLSADSGITPERLDALLTEISNIGAKPYAFGLRRRAQIQDMLESKMELISGVALVKPTNKLRPPFDLPIERLQKQA